MIQTQPNTTAHSPRRFPGMDGPLLVFGPRDRLDLRSFGSSGLIVGAPGSGKSTGPFAHCICGAHALGASVVHTSTKPNEAEFFARLARWCGRNDVSFFTLGRDSFNPLDHELKRGAGLPGHHERLVEIATTPLRRRRESGGGADGGFWEDEGLRYVSNLLTPFRLSSEQLSFGTLYTSLLRLPQSVKQVRDPLWRESSPACRAVVAADRTRLSGADRDDLAKAADFLFGEAPTIPSRTRASVVSTVVSAIYPFVQSEVGRTLCAEQPTWSPETIVREPGVLILDAALETYGPAAATLQRLLLTAIQWEILRRPMAGNPHPVLFALDEAHHFLDCEADARFGNSSRDRRGFLLTATQSIGNLRQAAARSSRDPHAACDALMGMFSTRMVCSTTDADTLEYVSRLGTPQSQTTYSCDPGGGATDKRTRSRPKPSISVTRTVKPEIPQHEVVALRTGGPRHNHTVDCFVTASGRTWSNGRPSIRVAFEQFRLGGR